MCSFYTVVVAYPAYNTAPESSNNTAILTMYLLGYVGKPGDVRCGNTSRENSRSLGPRSCPSLFSLLVTYHLPMLLQVERSTKCKVPRYFGNSLFSFGKKAEGMSGHSPTLSCQRDEC